MKRAWSMGAALSLGLAVAAAAQPAAAQTKLKFAFDWKFEAPAAPYFVALEKGHYAKEGLDVQVDSGKGSVQGINRVASGVYPLGSADINSLVKFRDKNPGVAVKGVMMLYDAPPFAIGTLARTGIGSPKDLEGKVLGAPAADGAYAQWKSFVKENAIDASKVTIKNIGFAVRSPMLVAGQVDAIAGYAFSMFLNLKSKGIAPEDIKIFLMSDYGLDLYGNAVMVNPDFAKASPEVVKAFVRASIKGYQDTVRDPEGAVEILRKHNTVLREAVEVERLKMIIRDNVLTPYVAENGMGDVDMKRFANSIEQIAVTYDFTNKPKPEDVFTAEFLPPRSERMLR